MTTFENTSTLLQHAGQEFRVGTGLISATENSVTFKTPRLEDVPVYARMSNTANHYEVQSIIAALHGGEEALVFGSGMSAFSTTLLALLKPGDHALVMENCYGTVQAFYQRVARNLNIDFTFAPMEKWESCVKPNTKILHMESISNPFCIPQDFSIGVKIAKSKNILLLCDNTFASPINCQPLKLGADIVLESGTKYLNGHSDVVCGAVIADKKLTHEIYEYSKILGGFLSTRDCMQLARGLRTLDLRMEKHNANGKLFAQKMAEKSFVEKVYFGGGEHLRTFFPNGYGGMCAVKFKKNVDVKKLIRTTKLISDVPSLGGTESKCTMPYYSTHYFMSDAEKLALGVDLSLVRYSVGLENVDDLVADIERSIS